MPEDFTVTLAANVSEFTAGMEQAVAAGENAARGLQGSFSEYAAYMEGATNGVEQEIETSIATGCEAAQASVMTLAEATEAQMAAIDARFAASGAVIRDYATEMQNSGVVQATEAERTSAVSQSKMAAINESEAGIRAQMESTAVVSGQASEAAEGSAKSQAAALQSLQSTVDEVTGQSVAASRERAAALETEAQSAEMSFRSMKAAFWDAWTAMFAVDMVVGAFKSLIDTTMQLGDATRMTATELGVTNNQARAFNETMSSLGVSSTTVSSAIRKLMTDASNGGKELARLKDATGSVITENRTGLDVFDQVITKINNISDSSQRAEAAYQLLGRGGMQLLSVIGQIPGRLAEFTSAQEKNTEANDAAVQHEQALNEALTKLRSAWEDDVISIAPAVEAALQVRGGALKGCGDDAQAAVLGLEQFAAAAENAVKAAADWANHAVVGLMNPDKTDKELFGDKQFQGMGQEGADLDTELPAETVHGNASGEWSPKPTKGGGGGKSKGGGADPMAGTDDALVSSQNEMDKLSKEMDKLGTEATAAGKVSQQSFDDLKTKAQNDYAEMKGDYDKWAAAVKSGDSEAAKAFEKDWKDATQKFQSDFDAATKKAQEDLKQVKSAASTLAGEVSGVLNQALSGKLNWATEINKIGGQMISELTKYLFTMVALMMQHQTMMAAAQAAGQGNMVGQMINWLAQKLGLEAAHNATSLGSKTATETGKTTATVTAQATQLATLSASLAEQLAVQNAAG